MLMLSVPHSQLKAALAEILDQAGAVKPERVRFFRGQMQTIITRAVTDLGMKPVPSRRCFTLISARPHHLPLEPPWVARHKFCLKYI